MNKLRQLEVIRQWGLPTPAFVGITYDEFLSGRYRHLVRKLTFPVAVRSSFSEEDSISRSFAGHFATKLTVQTHELDAAIQFVFDSYPHPQGQSVIIQQMVDPQISGVLFAYQQSVWKTEYQVGTAGVVSGTQNPFSLLLPRLGFRDYLWARLLPIWTPFPKQHPHRVLVRRFIRLAAFTRRLLVLFGHKAPHGLDIEYAFVGRKVYLLQARAITTATEAEEVLTSANHKEILPPQPSPMMTSIIASCSQHLFAYYQRLDPNLPERRFIQLSGGMPWINLSALLDTMVAWGLPSSLVTESVGADDPYRIRLRPYQILRKLPVFIRVLKEQSTVIGRTRRWVRAKQRYLLSVQDNRRLMWRNAPELAFNNWLTDMQVIYTELVNLMQALTGAMSGPIKFLARTGLLDQSVSQSESADYLQAFLALQHGQIERQQFLKQFGHRGFYESDIGQKRFVEYEEADWQALSISQPNAIPLHAGPNLTTGRSWSSFIARPFIRMLHTREWLRHHAMRYFMMLRSEIQEQTEIRLGKDVDFSAFLPEDLQKALAGDLSSQTLKQIRYRPPVGWDLDTFLQNGHDRRMPLSALSYMQQEDEPTLGLGIYPGTIQGQIWRVNQATLDTLTKPPFAQTILLTESLDPGWIPYFIQVQGVLSYVGGILSHASIILRESRIPAITRVPRTLQFQTGDWVEMDGRTGKIIPIPAPDP